MFAISISPLSFISVITNKLFFIKDFDKTMLRFVIVSTVLPDLETTTKQDFFKSEAKEGEPRLMQGLGNRSRDFFDKFLRESIVVSIHTRNIGAVN